MQLWLFQPISRPGTNSFMLPKNFQRSVQSRHENSNDKKMTTKIWNEHYAAIPTITLPHKYFCIHLILVIEQDHARGWNALNKPSWKEIWSPGKYYRELILTRLTFEGNKRDAPPPPLSLLVSPPPPPPKKNPFLSKRLVKQHLHLTRQLNRSNVTFTSH